MKKELPIIVFSHLRWDFVYQRPQHLLFRLATKRRVIFIEEPVYDEGAAPYWETSSPANNVLVCVPHLAIGGPGFGDNQLPVLKTMLHELLQTEELAAGQYVVWLYTPMALPLAQTLHPRAVVYDCMDELSAFNFAPPQLVEREARLMQWADVVFAGGPSLYRAKVGRHSNLHAFPSSVDAAHFRQARHIEEAADQKALPHPRLGFFGVVDERMDTGLLNEMALAHPEWQIIMIGPVVKIDQASLPKRPNLHFMGPRLYSDLPSYLAGWDVCLLPFALNESTHFISPTKTLEYMAAEKPIVSTPITDVVQPYGDIVYVGRTPAEFIAACERALNAPQQERAVRADRMRMVLSHTSWNTTAGMIDNLIVEAIERNTSPAQSIGTDSVAATSRSVAAMP